MNTLNFVLEVAERDMVFDNVGDALGYALPKAAFGFVTVFAVLALIWGILSLFKVFFYTIPNSRKKSEAPAKVVEAAPAASVVSAVSDDSEIVAAITAAISTFRNSSGQSNGSFRVVSFKKRK